jgi:N-acetylglucosaminyldiphosphoundecaprenol N-acetyl-beta-D-mannosaminyltransferase
MSLPRKKNLIGIAVDPVEPAAAAAQVLDAAEQGRPFSVSAIAVHGIMTGVLDPTHRYRLNRLELVVCDGQPVRWALNLLYHSGPSQRVYGPFLMRDVMIGAAERKLPVFFFGSTADVLDKMRRNLSQSYPGLVIAGMEASTFAPISPEAAEALAARIRASGARVVFVGLGCPRQEVWAYEYRQRIGLSIVAVGAAFPFAAGTLPQAPQWMQDRGLEWFFRLCSEPRRLWRRYLVLSPMYLALVFCQWLGFSFQQEGLAPEKEILYG